MDSFDPYLHWLNIPSQLRPMNHYILLGIRLFENDPSVIKLAGESRLVLLKQFQAGRRGELSEQIMTEIAQARIELLDSARRARYDRQLRRHLEDLDETCEHAVDSVDLVGSTELDPELTDASRPDSDGRHVQWAPSTLKKNALAQTPVESAVRKPDSSLGDPHNDSDGGSLFGLLLDIRILVALLSIVVVVMTATILLFSDRDPEGQLPEPDSSSAISDRASDEPTSEQIQLEIASKQPGAGRAIRAIQQAADGTFDLSPKLAELSRPEIELDSNKIAAWQTNDQAQWRLATTDRRSGYFYCDVTYQAKSESLFAVQLGQISERAFTLYPHREDFTERFIVRLEKSNEQTLTLMAKQVESIAEIQIKRIKLVPK